MKSLKALFCYTKNASKCLNCGVNWRFLMRNRMTIEFLGLWKKINNSDFKHIEFGVFRNKLGLNEVNPVLFTSKRLFLLCENNNNT